jgi:hypothetical protein
LEFIKREIINMGYEIGGGGLVDDFRFVVEIL